MLNRPTRQVPRSRHRGLANPARVVGTRASCLSHEAGARHPEPTVERLCSLIEIDVLQRLDEIFEKVRLLGHPGDGQAKDHRRAIRLPEVLKMLGISKSTLYGRINPASPLYDPLMPKPFKLGSTGRSPSVWWHGEVVAYLESCAQSSRTP
ncbi:helix-turn-helix transcriptional regulator [Dyella japonica]|uniref:DNA-binding transcriptional regulator AlpA n=1 Tax=Dyella japonica TaxID=231455 RepID=A0ABV2JW97_9GAMM